MKTACAPRSYRVPKDFTAEAELLKAAADGHRLRILAILARANQSVCVCDLNESLPLRQPTVSHHLKVLKDAGLITSERRGTWIYHKLAPGARALLQRILDIALPERISA